jgi:rubrerythrin
MPQFINPFAGMVPARKMDREELIRALRQDHAAEEEAIHLYTAHADATDNPVAKKILLDIADEEKVHAGEFLRLIEMLTGDEGKFILEAAYEVDQKTEGLRTPQTISPNFNVLDPLGLMNTIVQDVERIAEPAKKLVLGSKMKSIQMVKEE